MDRLSRSPDLQPGACGFHDSPLAVPSTLPGLYRLRLWVRAPTGKQKVTVHIDELVGEHPGRTDDGDGRCRHELATRCGVTAAQGTEAQWALA